jgi:hypothetical protein
MREKPHHVSGSVSQKGMLPGFNSSAPLGCHGLIRIFLYFPRIRT